MNVDIISRLREIPGAVAEDAIEEIARLRADLTAARRKAVERAMDLAKLRDG
jgi:hypothetical protein